MNAQQHYHEAEQALSHAWSGESTDPEMTIAHAQVHAMLALVDTLRHQLNTPEHHNDD